MIFKRLITDPDEVRIKLAASIEKGESLIISYLNQNSFNLYFKNQTFRKTIDNNFTLFPDGTGIYFFLKLMGNKNASRIEGTELFTLMMRELIRIKVPVVIVGGNYGSDIEKKAAGHGINLAAYHDGFFSESEFKEKALNISSYGNIFFIGMGAPRQEFFAGELQKTPGNKVIICSGNFLAFFFHYQKRAPVFFRKAGLEWLFRLLSEPRRLWRRYLLGIPEFIFRVIKLKFLQKGHADC